MSDIIILSEHLVETIQAAKRDGITGMSLANLRQITPTTGLTCSVEEFDRMFPEVADSISRRLRFTITNG